jgi:hypothetical protein
VKYVKFVRFFIDRFHQFGHKFLACGTTYSLKRMNGLGGGRVNFGEINSSICEQWHSSVDALSRHVASMSQIRFMFTVMVRSTSCHFLFLLLYAPSTADHYCPRPAVTFLKSFCLLSTAKHFYVGYDQVCGAS